MLAGVTLNNRKITKSDADDLVEWALRGANLWNEVKDRLDNPGIGLSGGQQQRLCIARAVAVHPDVTAHSHRVDIGGVQVLPFEEHLARAVRARRDLRTR